MIKCGKSVKGDFFMYEKFVNIINKRNGIITTKEAIKKGISKNYLKKMVDNKVIERLEYGIYITNKFIYDDMYIFALRHPNIIYSHNTSLYLKNMTERTPAKLDVTTKRNVNLSAYKEKINLYRVSDDIFLLGKCSEKTIYGNEVNAYNLERTVCDIINNKSKIDIEIANKAIKKCIKSKDFNASLMFEYAKKMKIYDKVKNYMEAII